MCVYSVTKEKDAFRLLGSEEKAMDENLKIIQIIPAVDWYAQYKGHDEVLEVPLVCWALCQNEEGERLVTGIDTSPDGIVAFCEDDSNFQCFVYKPK